MKLLKRLLLGVAALLVVLVAIILFRTFTFKPPVEQAAGVALAPAPTMDVNAAANRLGEAIRIKTVSRDGDEPADRTEWAKFLEWVQTSYPQSAAVLKRELVADYTPIYTWQGSDASLAPIVLMAHQDVVPVDPATEKDWKQKPFDGAVADGAVWGRGAIDDKGSLVAIFEATEALAKSGFQPKRTILIINGHDEETTQHGAVAAAAALKARGVTAEFVLDEGLITVADFPITKSPAALIGLAEKGYATLEITARAKGGHSSTPPKETAVGTVAKAIVAITENQDPMKLDGPGALTVRTIAPYAGFVTKMAVANDWLFAPVLIGEFSKTGAGAALLHTTTAPTMLEGSPKENVLAQVAKATINYRIVPGQTSADVMARAKASVGDLPVEFGWTGLVKEPSRVSSTDTEAWKILSALASDDGKIPVAPGLVLASTDSSNLSDVAKDIYRFQPIVLSLDETSSIHGVDEHITLDNLKKMMDFYARLIATAGAR